MEHCWNFDSDTGLTYDSDLIAIGSGVAQLRPVDDCAFLARWNAGFNADYSLGTVTAGMAGAPAIDNVNPQFGAGCLQLQGGVAGEYVGYIGPNVANLGNAGCVRFGYRPNYAGAPIAARHMFSCGNDPATNNNRITLYHDFTGNIEVRILNAAGAVVINWSAGAWVPIAGAWYDIELDWDAAGTYLFVNGVSLGVNPGGVAGRTTTSTYLFIGNDRLLVQTPDAAFDDFQIFPGLIHNANFVPPALEAVIFSVANPTIVTEQMAEVEFRSFEEHMEEDDGDVRYLLRLEDSGTHDEYYTGTEWIHSDGTYAQTSTAAQVIAGLPGHTLTHEAFRLVVFLHSDDGISTPVLGRVCLTTASYASLVRVRRWLESISQEMKSDAWVARILDMTDRWVGLKLSKWPSMLEELPDTEDFVRALAEAAGVAGCLQAAYSEEGESAENNDRVMWEKERDELLAQFLKGEILASAGPAAQTIETNASRVNRYPVFGYGKWSERILSMTKPDSQAGYYPVREGLP